MARGDIRKILIAVAVGAFVISACTGKDSKEKIAQAPAVAPLTPEEQKQKEFDAERSARGYILTKQIKASAFDPDALKLKSPKYYKNGVCVEANGKNRFGGYVGWKEYCYLVDNNGVWTLQE